MAFNIQIDLDTLVARTGEHFYIINKMITFARIPRTCCTFENANQVNIRGIRKIGFLILTGLIVS